MEDITVHYRFQHVKCETTHATNLKTELPVEHAVSWQDYAVAVEKITPTIFPAILTAVKHRSWTDARCNFWISFKWLKGHVWGPARIRLEMETDHVKLPFCLPVVTDRRRLTWKKNGQYFSLEQIILKSNQKPLYGIN